MNIKWMVHTLKYKLQENNSKISWRSNIVNTSLEGHNTIQKEANLIGCILGYGTYIERGTQLINVKLGRYSSIAPGVKYRWKSSHKRTCKHLSGLLFSKYN